RLFASDVTRSHRAVHSFPARRSSDLMQVRQALVLLQGRIAAVLGQLAERAAETATLVISGRSHNVPAQATTVGKRIANSGEELLDRKSTRLNSSHVKISNAVFCLKKN